MIDKKFRTQLTFVIRIWIIQRHYLTLLWNQHNNRYQEITNTTIVYISRTHCTPYNCEHVLIITYDDNKPCHKNTHMQHSYDVMTATYIR